MESERDTPAPWARLKNSFRVELDGNASEEERGRYDLKFALLEVVVRHMEVKLDQIYCCREYIRTGALDITLRSAEELQQALERWETAKERQEMAGVRVRSLWIQDYVQLYIHVYDPFLEEEAVVRFLDRYCSRVLGGTKLNNNFGVWNGRRRFLVKFRMDQSKPGGYMQPPGFFSLGAVRGHLSYRGQPAFCRRCREPGHETADCEGPTCWRCGGRGHMAAECLMPKKCVKCGESGHLVAACPKRTATYADVAADSGAAESFSDEAWSRGEQRPGAMWQARPQRQEVGGRGQREDAGPRLGAPSGGEEEEEGVPVVAPPGGAEEVGSVVAEADPVVEVGGGEVPQPAGEETAPPVAGGGAAAVEGEGEPEPVLQTGEERVLAQTDEEVGAQSARAEEELSDRECVPDTGMEMEQEEGRMKRGVTSDEEEVPRKKISGAEAPLDVTVVGCLVGAKVSVDMAEAEEVSGEQEEEAKSWGATALGELPPGPAYPEVETSSGNGGTVGRGRGRKEGGRGGLAVIRSEVVRVGRDLQKEMYRAVRPNKWK